MSKELTKSTLKRLANPESFVLAESAIAPTVRLRLPGRGMIAMQNAHSGGDIMGLRERQAIKGPGRSLVICAPGHASFQRQ